MYIIIVIDWQQTNTKQWQTDRHKDRQTVSSKQQSGHLLEEPDKMDRQMDRLTG